MKLKILLIEADERLKHIILERLTAENYLVEAITDGYAGVAQARRLMYDLIILDTMSFDLNGLTILRELRASGCITPILLLTLRTHTEDKITDLMPSAQDYLEKPFDISELSSRVAMLLQRSTTNLPTVDRLTHSELEAKPEIDLRRGYIISGNIEHSLSTQEIKLLDYFCKHPDSIISREELLHAVWNYDIEISTRTIDVHIARIRQKMGDLHDGQRYIHTIRGIGYKFTPP